MPANHWRFVVHEHKATRLHYDFRLEIGAVLKSWAIPKGPSLNPADKRLAVMVPDHALSHINYEGIIPAGHSGAGPVVVWDAGEFIPLDAVDPDAALKAGTLSFQLKGKKLNGAFTLIRMQNLPRGTGKEWLLIKKKDAHARTDFTIRTELTPARLKKLIEKLPSCETE